MIGDRLPLPIPSTEVKPPEVQPRSWKLACKTACDITWCYNALRYPTKAQCEAAGCDLASRWTNLESWEAHPSDDEPNRP